jgi:hypothetical protein
MAAQGQALRIVCIAALLPAFPLLVAHASLSCMPVPVTGLVPLFFSAGVSLFLVIRQRQKSQTGGEDEEQQQVQPDPAEAGPAEASRGPTARNEVGEQQGDPYTHPFLVFVIDTILAAALLIVLIFTWIEAPRLTRCSPWVSLRKITTILMLAAYGTIPLLINL